MIGWFFPKMFICSSQSLGDDIWENVFSVSQATPFEWKTIEL